MEPIDFYKNLLSKALLEIKEGGYNTIVFGPMKTQTPEFNKNLLKLQEVVSLVKLENYKVFDQVPYLDIHLEKAPFDFAQKFPIFFGGILASGLITDAFFVPGWEESHGSVVEHQFCEQNNVNIHYL